MAKMRTIVLTEEDLKFLIGILTILTDSLAESGRYDLAYPIKRAMLGLRWSERVTPIEV